MKMLVDYPELIKEFDVELNLSINPNILKSKSHIECYWKCSKDADHIWKARVEHRTRGCGCPYCAGQKVDPKTCLAVCYPDIASQIHPTLNNLITGYDLTSKSNRMLYWQCNTNNDHIWKTSVDKRTDLGRNCPYCKESRGEKAISKYLDSLKMNYIRQYKLLSCRTTRLLPFDFGVIIDDNLFGLIEFQGRQHYEPINYFGGEKSFLRLVKRDLIKRMCCFEENIPLLCIYHEMINDIPAIIDNFLGR